MRIVLVHPHGSNMVPGKRDIVSVANRVVPIGLISIAAHLESLGHEIRIVDCLGPKPPKGTQGAVAATLAHDPEIVGFSATTSGFLDAYDIAAGIKQTRPGVQTVFGGVHVSAIGAPLLEQFPLIDALCVGEGELTLAELASGQAGCEIAGLVFRDGEQIVSNPPRTNMRSLDELPFPAYHKLEGFPKGYHLPAFSYIRTPGTAISTSRGCVYQCSFCDRSVFQRGFRSNSAEYTYEHLKMLRERHSIRHVNIYDDLFTTNRRRILDLCSRLVDKPLGMNFNCAVRVGHCDDELLEALAAAGFLALSVGIESGDPDLLASLKTGVALEDVRDTVHRIQAKGLRAKGLFMMGVVGETEESIQKTSDFILELGLDDMNVSKFTPFHGAPLWSTIREHGIFQEDWRQMNALNFVFVPKAIESRERLDELYNRHVKRFYTSPEWRKKFMARLWENRETLRYMLLHLPSFMAARRHFTPKADHG